MVKTRLIPTTRMVTFEVPESFVGMEIEILAYSNKELQPLEKNSQKVDWSEFVGILSKEKALEMQEYLKEARSEWDRDTF